ncbi:hypothetical protein LEP1GSC068_3893 [Leptospira sp. Fiocruz LV3954]|nr:hypothetical protein LEP1GSC068_3893 [Leptospira sp. Fiocruz LV3954]EMI62434.1 hypothetical protein LEP1GSC076_3969 [Leptospira sp. Fiocruz LV4135]
MSHRIRREFVFKILDLFLKRIEMGDSSFGAIVNYYVLQSNKISIRT